MGRTALAPTSSTNSPALTQARDLLVAAAPQAAAVLLSGLVDDASKEQIEAAKDVLDRCGLRKDAQPAAPAPDTVISEVALGAFKALLQHFDIQMPAVDPPIPVEHTPGPSAGAPDAPRGLSLPTEEAEKEPPPEAKPPRARRRGKKKREEDDFFLSLEEKGREDEGIPALGAPETDETVDGGGLA
jgi:hypothetical protein